MVISNYFYETSKTEKKDHLEFINNRTGYATAQFLKHFKQQFADIKLEGRTAFILAAGVTSSQSENRVYSGEYKNTLDYGKSSLVIKETTAYSLHKYIGAIKDSVTVTYANINSNSCASSMHSIYEAQTLFETRDIDHVIVVTEERTATNTIRIFDEHQIDVVPSDGFACVVLSKDGGGTPITDAKWEYFYNSNPFYVDSEGYSRVNTPADHVKGHGTGTTQNTEAESVLSDTVHEYKSKIGHTQGASALIELCMVLEDDALDGKVLCTASGLGGFYGSCIVHKSQE